MQLTLLVPELIWPEPDDSDTFGGLACPALNTLLARSRLTRRPPQSLEATLSDAFGLPEGAPYAAFRLLGEANTPVEVGASCWLCSDPVHLRFHQERLILADSGSFGIALDEAQALAEALNTHLADLGRFHVATAERWYLQVAVNGALDASSLANFDVPPLSAVAGRSIERLLPETAKTKELRKLLNEAQMLLHAHAINQKRQNTGRLPINSLWLWGAGTLPERSESGFDGVWSTNPLALGLARAAGVPTHPLPLDLSVLLEHAAPETSHLIVLEDLLGAVQYENGDAYRTTLTSLESRWFAPLRSALATGKIRQLRLEASTAYAALAWESRRSDQWKLWRRPQTLVTVAQNLAKGNI
ncbi:hypothetical protein [Propionivibrio sp.]|uniref:hypothetical protein n=1 Tax=Propionivibrio sp. TaxID=2212460 RepID=UPI003BF08592